MLIGSRARTPGSQGAACSRLAVATRRSSAIQSLSVAAVPGETERGAVQNDSMLTGSGLPIRSLCVPKSPGSAESSAPPGGLRMPINA